MDFVTEFEISKLIFGTLTLGPLQKNFSVADGSKCILYAYENGVNMFDTAQYYKTYPYLKELLQKYPQAKISTKSYAYDRAGAIAAVEECMKETGREYIDFFLMHEQESEHTIRGHKEALETYLEYQQKGIIGNVGISTHHVAGVFGVLKYPEIKVLHPMINYQGLGIVDGSRKEMEEAISKVHSTGVLTYGMKIFGGGNLLQNREKALDYAIGCEFLDGIALGMSSKQEIDYNVAYINGDKQAARNSGAEINGKHLYIEEWCIGCGNCVERCPNGALELVDNTCRTINDKCVLCGYCAPVCPEFAIKVI